MFHPISNTEKWIEKHKSAAESFFFFFLLKQIRGVSKSDESLYRASDIAAQTNYNNSVKYSR